MFNDNLCRAGVDTFVSGRQIEVAVGIIDLMMPTELNARTCDCETGGEQKHLVMSMELKRPVIKVFFHLLAHYVSNFQKVAVTSYFYFQFSSFHHATDGNLCFIGNFHSVVKFFAD